MATQIRLQEGDSDNRFDADLELMRKMAETAGEGDSLHFMPDFAKPIDNALSILSRSKSGGASPTTHKVVDLIITLQENMLTLGIPIPAIDATLIPYDVRLLHPRIQSNDFH
jgi:hypothetical protein